jgi:dihydropteroate synthase
MSKRFNKNNLTRILHDIRESYSRTFHESIPKGANMENILIDAARQVKEGKRVSWELVDGIKKLKIT